MALAVLLASLEPNHLRSQGAGSGEVLPAGTGTHTLPDCSSAVKGDFTEGAASNASRNSGSASEAGHSRDITSYGPVHQQALCHSKKDGSLHPVPLNRFLKNRHFKMESQGVDEEKGLAALVMHCGSERCVSFSSHCKAAQEVSEICMGGNHISVHLSVVWSVQCTKNIHQAIETSHGLPTLSGTQNGLYQDEILILAKNRDTLIQQVHYTVQLLDYLGFTTWNQYNALCTWDS